MIHNLIVYPVYTPFPGFEQRLEAIARNTGLTVYDLRQRFIGAAPALLRRSEDEQLLRKLAAAVTRAGLAAAVIDEGQRRALREPERVSSVEVYDGEIVFQFSGGDRLAVRNRATLFLVAGSLRSPRSDTAQAVRASLPEARAPDAEKRLSRMAFDYPLLDVYLPETGRAFRVEGDRFNYAGLAEARKDSAAFNFLELVSLLRSRAGGCVQELGFGLSTIPGCTPGELGTTGNTRDNLKAFNSYSALMFLCFRDGLFTAAEGYSALGAPGAGADTGAPGAPVATAAETLPAPPEHLRVYRTGPLAALPAGKQIRDAIRSLSPAWLLLPLLASSLLFAVAGIGFETPAFFGFGAAALGLFLLVRGVELGARKRLIENTPTSRIRSMAMGFVELVGKARRKYELKVPYLLADCVYYRYSIQEKRNTGRGSQWMAVEAGQSGPVPFLLQDDTGRVLVDPEGAIVQAVVRQQISGESAVGLGGLMMAPGQRLVIEYIPEGYTTYLCGFARPHTPDPHAADALLRRRLLELKRSPERLSQYDTDQDGRIDAEEWSRARAEVQRGVDAERLFSPDGPQSAGGEQVVIGRGGRAGRFYIRGEDERSVVKSLKLNMLINMAFGGIVFIVALVYLLRISALG